MTTRLSVIVPTTRPWPEVRPCLEALLPQMKASRADIIVADGNGDGVPDDVLREHGRVLRVHRHPGASVFELRAMALADATADILAITEDHCIPAPDWCERLVDAFDSNPNVLGVAGAVANGSRRRLIDRANYFITFAGATPPIVAGSYGIPPVSNVSFRRAALPSWDVEPGHVELHVAPHLLAEGRMLLDDRVLVDHVQSHGFVGTFPAHFHNGRSSLGLLTQGQTWPERRRRLRRQLTRPYWMTRSTYAALRPKRSAKAEAVPSFPLIAMLAACYTAGAIVGLLLGPGTSPRKLA